MKSKFYLIFYSIVLCACQHPKESVQLFDTGKIIRIDVEEIDEKMFIASALIDSCVYIPLETSDTTLIGKIRKIDAWKDRFYIWDQVGEAVYIYHTSGKLLCKIHHCGRGKGEYPRTTGFALDKTNGHVYIACDMLQSILEYDDNGNYIKSISCPFCMSDFVVLGKDSLIWYGGQSYNQSYFKDITPNQYRFVFREHAIDKIKDLKFNYDLIFSQLSSNTRNFFNFQDTLYLVENVVNDVYEVSPVGNLKLRYKIDFKDKNIPISYDSSPSEVQEVLNIYRKDQKKWSELRGVLENDKVVLVEYAYEGLIHEAIYSKSADRIYNIGPVWLNDIDKIGMPDLYNTGLEGKVLIGCMESYLLKELAESPNCELKIKELAKKLSVMDNPVVVKIYFK